MDAGSFRIVDLHSDLPWDIVRRRDNGERRVLEQHHLEKMRKGLVSAVISPIWVESSNKPAGALKRALHIADAFRNDLTESDNFQLSTSYSDLLAAEAKGKISLVFGAEGGEFIEDDLGLLRIFHRLGLRVFGFCWNQRNLMADGWDHYRDDRGLTDFGKQVIDELDRIKIVMDLAHMSRKGFWGVMDASRRPVIVSHTCTALDRAFRAMNDDQLKAVASHDGIVGIIAATRGPKSDPESYAAIPDLRTYCDHIEYGVKVAGPEHIGIGPDFIDYYLGVEKEVDPLKWQVVKDLESHSKLGNVVSELSRRGLPEDQIRMITRDNFLRVFREVVG